MNPHSDHDKLCAARYTIDDACNQRDSSDHVQAILQYGKSDILNVENQALFAWIGFSPQLRQDIKRSRIGASVTEFIQMLNEMKQTWYD